MGLGFAWYAEESIRQELDSGSLARLPLTEGAERYVTLYLVYADREGAGPGARRLVDLVREEVAQTATGTLT
jgi:DNA-binding transcriptional LysR family regulator